MPMEVTSKSLEEVIVIYVGGNLTTNSCPKVEAEVKEILEGMAKNVIINVESVNLIDSTGLRIILALGKRLNSNGLKLSVCSMNANTKSVFDMCGFAKIFPLFENEEKALASLL